MGNGPCSTTPSRASTRQRTGSPQRSRSVAESTASRQVKVRSGSRIHSTTRCSRDRPENGHATIDVGGPRRHHGPPDGVGRSCHGPPATASWVTSPRRAQERSARAKRPIEIRRAPRDCKGCTGSSLQRHAGASRAPAARARRRARRGRSPVRTSKAYPLTAARSGSPSAAPTGRAASAPRRGATPGRAVGVDIVIGPTARAMKALRSRTTRGATRTSHS